MSWNFTFQGSQADALTALNNVKVTTDAGAQDQWNRVMPTIQGEIQALNNAPVVISCSGAFCGAPPNKRSIVHVNVQNQPVLNNAVLVPPNTSKP